MEEREVVVEGPAESFVSDSAIDLALFADRPEVQSALGVFVDTLDDCWYGQRATDHAHYQDCLARYERLK